MYIVTTKPCSAWIQVNPDGYLKEHVRGMKSCSGCVRDIGFVVSDCNHPPTVSGGDTPVLRGIVGVRD